MINIKNKDRFKKIVIGSIVVMLIGCISFMGYREYNIKSNIVSSENVHYEKLYDISLNGDNISVTFEDNLTSDKYGFSFLSEKTPDNSNNVYIPKENIDKIDLSLIEDTYDYYKSIEYPLSNYLVDVYLKNIVKVQDEDSINEMKVSINSTEKDDKTGSVMEIKANDKEPFIYTIDFEDSFDIKITYDK